MRSYKIKIMASAFAMTTLATGVSPALAGNDVVMDFESLAESGSGTVLVGESYSEDGYTLNEIGTDSGKSFESIRLDSTLFAGSTGLFNNEINSTVELVKNGGGAFRLASIDLAPLLFSAKGLETSVTFTGELDGSPVAMQTFTTLVAQPFETFVFNTDFANVDRVTWVQSNNVGTVDFHQFDEIVLTELPPIVIPDTTCDVVMDFEILAKAGTGIVLVGETYSEDGFTLNEIGTNPGQFFASWRLGAPDFAGSTGLLNDDPDSITELIQNGGGSFRLASIDLAPALFSVIGFATSVTFTGELDGNPVATQTFITSVAQPFETFVFSADFANVDRVTWVQSKNPGITDFHQFDNIALTAPMQPVIDFESLAQAGSGSQIIGATYSEDGFTLTPASASLFIWQLSSTRFAGSTGLWVGNLTTIELVKQGGGAFRLAAIDLSPLNNAGIATTVTFTGERDGSPVAMQVLVTPTAQSFSSFIFNDDFKNVDRVTWVQGFTPDTHQFDDIVLGDAVATILETATLGTTGLTNGPFTNDQFLGARFSLTEPTRITEIGGHLVVTSGSIWGAIIPLPSPGATPPFGFDVEANALAHAQFEFTDGLSADLCKPVDVFLPPGDYALLFGGAGLFGSTGAGRMPQPNSPLPPQSIFFRGSSGTWFETTGPTDDIRFVIRGTPIPCNSCDGDANGDLVVNFADITSVLGNWLNVCPTNEIVFESAALGPTGVGSGLILSGVQYLGARFSLSEATAITSIGGHLSIFGGSVWGAIIPLFSPGALPPDGFNVEAEALASALFGPTASGLSEDVVEPVDVTLAPGDYALVFGAGGLFGSTGGGFMPGNDTDIGAPSYFFFDLPQGWVDGLFNDARFVVEGDELCTTCDGDADGSGIVNFADITSVLGNWLKICP